MEAPKSVQVKILSTPSFSEAFKAEAQNNTEAIKILSAGVEKDPTKLAFAIGDVESVIAIITGVFYLGEMSVKIYRWLKGSDIPKIVIHTPVRTIEITNHDGLTEEEVSSLLRRSLEAT
jgi:hypothetical protein